MSALKGLVSVPFCVILCQQSTRTKTESHLLTSTRRPQKKAAPLCEKYSKTCVTYVIGTVVWTFIHTAVLLNATACNHIKIGHRDTHKKGLQQDEVESSIRQHTPRPLIRPYSNVCYNMNKSFTLSFDRSQIKIHFELGLNDRICVQAR